MFAKRAPCNSVSFFCAFGYMHGSSKYLNFKDFFLQIFSKINGVLILSNPIVVFDGRSLMKLSIDFSGCGLENSLILDLKSCIFSSSINSSIFFKSQV